MRPNLRPRTRAHRSRLRGAAPTRLPRSARVWDLPRLLRGVVPRSFFPFLPCAPAIDSPLGRSFLSLSMFKDIYQLCGHVRLLHFRDSLTEVPWISCEYVA